MTLEPAATRMPGRTAISHSGPNSTSHARAELDEAHAFAGGDAVAGLLVEDNAARDQAGDLLENHAGARRPRR